MNDIVNERLDELAERVRQLEEILRYKKRPSYEGISLTRSESVILAELMKSPGISSNRHLADLLGVTTVAVKVVICRLRPKLYPHARIITAHGEGYCMTEDGRKRLAEMEIRS